jgi:hypothetical protein
MNKITKSHNALLKGKKQEAPQKDLRKRVKCTCGKTFVKSEGLTIYNNYGGQARSQLICGHAHYEILKEYAGDRVSLEPVNTTMLW